jgi:hypothetical protein
MAKANRNATGLARGAPEMVLERGGNPKRSRRTCTGGYEPQSRRGKSAGVANLPPETPHDSQLFSSCMLSFTAAERGAGAKERGRLGPGEAAGGHERRAAAGERGGGGGSPRASHHAPRGAAQKGSTIVLTLLVSSYWTEYIQQRAPQRALTVTQRALSVTQRALSVTQRPASSQRHPASSQRHPAASELSASPSELLASPSELSLTFTRNWILYPLINHAPR